MEICLHHSQWELVLDQHVLLLRKVIGMNNKTVGKCNSWTGAFNYGVSIQIGSAQCR